MDKQEEIREIINAHVDDKCHFPDRSCNAFGSGNPFGSGYCSSDDESYKCLMERLTKLGVVIKVEGGLPFKWGEVTKKHSYSPYKVFTSYTLSNKCGKMFGYVQKYQSLTGYKCFEKPVRFSIYLGDRDGAHSWKSVPTLKEAKRMLLENFLSSKDNEDREIPEGYTKTKPLVEG